MNVSLGEYLELLRISCGYTLRQASKKTGLSHGYIRDLELGHKGTIPRPDTLKKFASAYKVSYNELMHIAGYLEQPIETEVSLIKVELQEILYIEVASDDLVSYQMDISKLKEKKSLFEFILLEDLLEKNNFLRLKSGLYINLNRIDSYNPRSGELSFLTKNFKSKLIISNNIFKKVNREINEAIKKLSLEVRVNDNVFIVIRNLLV